MRGEKEQLKDKKPNGNGSTIKATNLSHIAVIQDEQGNIVYLIKSTWWYSIVTALFIIMLLITVLMTGAIYLNYLKVVQVEQNQEDEQQKMYRRNRQEVP